MDKNHDNEHAKSNSSYQYSFFEEIIKKQNPLSNISVYKPYIEDVNKFSFEYYDAFLWTGGLGNIYNDNDHNKNQLKIFDRIVILERPIWGSCWGLQVAVTAFGGKISSSMSPEFGYSEKIKIIKNHFVYKNKKNLFTAPGHHYDSLETLPKDFDIISENNHSIQSICHKKQNIFCTQYHPELPYNYIGKLMSYWKRNYLKIMSENEFEELLNKLQSFENEDQFNRELELLNWLENIKL